MTDRGSALLDLRWLLHISVLGMIVASGYMFGPSLMRNRIDEWVVTPISYTAKWLWNPAAVRNVHPPEVGGTVNQP